MYPSVREIVEKTSNCDPGLLDNIFYAPLVNRGITEETCRLFGYGLSVYKNQPVQVASYYNLDGELVSQKLRTRDKEFPWVGSPKNASLFGLQMWKENKSIPIIITEGEIDAMSVSQAFNHTRPVVSLKNGAGDAKCLEPIIGKFSYYILCFDSDVAGQAAVLKVAKMLGHAYTYVVKLPRKDANEVLLKDGEELLRKLVLGAEPVNMEGVKSVADLEYSWLTTALPMGIDTGFPFLDKMLRGLHRGRLLTFTGVTGRGKTTATLQMAGHLMYKHGLTVGGYFAESSLQEAVWSMIGLKTGYSLEKMRENPLCMGKKKFDEALAEIKDRFIVSGNFDGDSEDKVMEKFRYMADRGADVIIYDSLSYTVDASANSQIEDRKRIDMTMSALRSEAQNRNIIVIVIVQIKHCKLPIDKDTGFRFINLHDIKGSGGISNFSDAVVALEDNEIDTNLRRFTVLKNRVSGTIGFCDVLQRDKGTGKLVPVERSVLVSEDDDDIF